MALTYRDNQWREFNFNGGPRRFATAEEAEKRLLIIADKFLPPGSDLSHVAIIPTEANPTGVKAHQAEREEWVIQYAVKEHCLNAVNAPFHEAYNRRFPEYARRETNWGAAPVKQAMLDLASLHSQGIMKRFRMGLPSGNWQPGFPKHCLCYDLPEDSPYRKKPV